MRRALFVPAVALLATLSAKPAAADDRSACRNPQTSDTAIAACTRLISSRKTRGRELSNAYVSRGYHHNIRRDYDRAIADLNEAIRIEPKNVMAYDNRSFSYRQKGEHDRAIADLNEVIRLGHPKKSDAHAARGYLFLLKGEHDRAINDLNEAIRLGAKSAVVYRSRAVSFTKKGELDRALGDFDEAIRLDQTSARTYYERGEIWRAKKEFDRAIADYDQATRLDANYTYAYMARGFAWRGKGNNDRAIADFDQALRLDPKSAAVHRDRGQAWAAKGENDRAIADYDQAIQLGPADSLLYRLRALAWMQKRDFDRAVADYGEAIRVDPKDVIAYRARGIAHREKGEFDAAIADFTAAIRLDPALLAAYAGRGLAHEKKGELERARADFNVSLSLPAKDEVGRRSQEVARERLAALDAAGASSAAAAPAAPPQPTIAAPVSTAVTGPRAALVIGNSDYRHAARLANPSNDASDIARTLRKLGFDVVEGRDLDKRGMEDKVREFGRKLDRANLALFFYAGHGMQVGGKNYLIPIDAKLERPGDLALDTIDVGQVLAQMEAEQRVNLVFLDACRDNPLARSFARSLGTRSASVGHGLASIQSAVGTMIAYATQPDNVALDGEGRNSPFTKALLAHLATPGLEIGSLMRRVRADVVQATRGKQVPWDHSSLIGDIVLAQ
jgi:tetratricopeptide (TPR) repeat protein